MSVVNPNKTWQKQFNRIVKSGFKKGFINAVHISSGTVDVYFAENPQTIIKNIPVSKNITMASVMAGQRCKIDIFDEINPNDMVVAYTY
jgi:hypothetical protein